MSSEVVEQRPFKTDVRLSESDARRFWMKVAIRGPDDCWEWQGGKMKDGYGQIGVRHVCWPTHRLMFILVNGPIPQGMLVLHRCDNPPCINPKHLFLGTNLDNTRDMIAKGRRGKCGPPESPHGSLGRYDKYGCRCDTCRIAKVDYNRQWRARRRARASG